MDDAGGRPKARLSNLMMPAALLVAGAVELLARFDETSMNIRSGWPLDALPGSSP